jgi:hypothetical protein
VAVEHVSIWYHFKEVGSGQPKAVVSKDLQHMLLLLPAKVKLS